MTKKVLAAVWYIVLMFSLAGCGTGHSEVTTPTGAEEVIEETEREGEIPLEEIKAESDDASESGEQEEKAESVVTWYMDEEGIKSDLLGMFIGRNNEIADEMMRLYTNMFVYSEESDRKVGKQLAVWCQYYEGDVDGYISENSSGGYLKDKIGEIEYAYRDNTETSSEVIIVGNGLAVYIPLWDITGSTKDYLQNNQIIMPYDEFTEDCLAYITKDGLYCPRLGLAFIGEENVKQPFVIGAECYNSIDVGIDFEDRSVNTVNGESAQQVVDDFVANAIEPFEHSNYIATEIEGTVEKAIGNYTYLGRGVSCESSSDWGEDEKWEKWCFYSQEANWSISINYDMDMGINYENCLGIIENM